MDNECSFSFQSFSFYLISFLQLKEVKENKEEEEAEEVEKEVEEVFDLNERKKNKSLHYKRSFFVRMVSDPKIYNPKIVRSLPGML